MPIERFSVKDFEDALPKPKHGNKKLWYYLGPEKGERCYMVPVNAEVEIMIRSSIPENDTHCSDTGEDSIRVTIVDSIERRPLEAKDTKVQRWVARTKNWRTNLIRVLRTSYAHASWLRTCPNCKTEMLRISRSKKDVSKDRLYLSCWNKQCKGYFKWLDELLAGDGRRKDKP